nr:RNA-directed DNA polymerase, eukaryota [Tanacetum cinerariifolium]
MGSYRSKVDDVNRISTSIFVTNFPESFSAKDLFQSYKQYGHVVDSFIALKRSKEGKRFGFVRFINVFNVERLGADSGKLFVNVVKSIYKSGTVDCEANPAIVLDDDCLNSKDLTNSLLGRVKEFTSLYNLKMVLTNEGFVDISVRYMGELWVLLEFASTKSKELFRDNVGVGSWFSELKQASFDFNPDGRVVWVEVEGEESCFHSKRLCLYTKFHMNIFENFKMIFRGKVFWVRAKEVPGWVPKLLEESDEEVQSDDGSMEGDNKVQYAKSSGDNSEVAENSKENKENVNEKDQSLEYPLGFTSNAEENDRNVNGDKSQKCNMKEVFAGRDGDSTNRGSKGDASKSTPNTEENDRKVNGDASKSVCLGRFKKSEVSRTRGSFLGLMEEVVKLGQTMGYNMEGCVNNLPKKDWVRELCVNNKVNFSAIQETKMENMELRCVRSCWGNYAFDYIHSDSVAVYAPHEPRDKCMLWDYLVHTINQWDGEVVIMGDFNEVRHKYDRFGLIFNGQGADEFNSFIANTGLENVPLGGSAFTWCLKSATKMSKLDRFLISKNLFITCPHITATTLERYLSDHQPILFHETSNDYGPIREWIKSNRHSKTGMKEKYKEELRTLDDDIDNGNGSDIVVHKRMEVINALQRIDKLNAMEITQKTKIKWSIEGDENSQFFHGMLNKKRNQLNIRGVMVDGVWNEKPHDVKREFFQHFCNRFDKPMEHRAVVDMCYPRSLLIDQQEDLERMVTKEEVKKAVWDCGTDKSPGPDGFTLGFYRQFLLTIENDVFEAVSHFFKNVDIPKGCNPSFIALILKIPDDNMVNDFRPISLIGSIYKIIAKILTNRLVRVLGDIVNETCLKSSRGSILINGSPTEEFQFCKGLKQGDPLSPFLVILIMESLHLSFQRVVDAGLFMGIKLSHLVNLSHMFYADDAVFVGQWSDSNINTLIHLLDCFYRASGLRMNMSKSKIMGVHVEGGMVKHAASKLGCLTLNTPFYYLGSKVGGSMSRVQAWKEVIDKVKSRLSKWIIKALFIGGRLTLLKSVLGSIPIFHMSIFRVPSSVLHTLESIRGQFFNGHEVGSNKATRVKWNSVLTAKDNGGLGVSSLYALNRGLMMNWVWRFYNQKTSLWANVIKAIHGEDKSIDLYPHLYALKNGKSMNVCTKLSDPSMDYSFRCKTRGGAEHEQLDALMDLVSTINLVSMGDRWVWTLESSGEFSVASLRKVIDEKRLSSVCSKTR